MTRTIILDVPVSEPVAAVRFYGAAFGAIVSSNQPDPVGGAVHLELRSMILRVCDEATHAANESDALLYQKGKTPRLELQVDDLQAWIDRAAGAGARLRYRLPSDGAAATYVQILDPFGHLWSFTNERC